MLHPYGKPIVYEIFQMINCNKVLNHFFFNILRKRSKDLRQLFERGPKIPPIYIYNKLVDS